MQKTGFLLLLLLVLRLAAAAQTPAEANKRLFDRTVDELNFRTFETVYDKSFTRGKFPLTLRSAAARRKFDGFGDNTALKQLFMNYNGIAERFKGRYGNGPMTQAEFEKQLNSVLLDRNFEFFIHNLPRDERVALIRAEQRLIKQAAAQFNAAGSEEVPTVPAAEMEADAGPATAPLTTHDAEPALVGEELPVATPVGPPAPRHDWLDYFTLLLSLGSFLTLLYLTTNVVPALSRRINSLAFEPEPEPAPERRSLLSRLRASRPTDIRDDHYDDDDDDEPAAAPAARAAYAETDDDVDDDDDDRYDEPAPAGYHPR